MQCGWGVDGRVDGWGGKTVDRHGVRKVVNLNIQHENFGTP